jgi:uncharacterized protein (DUF305 family)
MYKIIILLIVGLFLFIILKNNKENFEEPCSNNLSDLGYLQHMIPHHQVAVDISIMLQKKSKDPIMQDLLRKLIWTQKYEIKMMGEMLTKLPNNDMSEESNMNTKYISSISDFVKPNKLDLTNTYCDPNFFDPETHMKHLSHMKLDDNMYLKHMIPHHQVAVDMSKKLLNNTKNDFMIYLAYRIIRSQQSEIILLNDMLSKKNYKYQSNLIS